MFDRISSIVTSVPDEVIGREIVSLWAVYEVLQFALTAYSHMDGFK